MGVFVQVDGDLVREQQAEQSESGVSRRAGSAAVAHSIIIVTVEASR
jgi:hypothetical protein